jgi:hypothetical protein
MRSELNKHLLMLSAAVTALLAQQASAATTISTIGSSPISTQTDGDITITSAGGVDIKQAGAAVTVNTSSALSNGGRIANVGSDNAKGILIDASGGALSTTVSNTGTIDLTGSGSTKNAIDITGGLGNTITGPITLSSGGLVKVQGDNSNAILLEQSATLVGTLSMGGSVSIAPASANSLSAGTDTLVMLNGPVIGNVLTDSSATFSGAGEGTRGIVLSSTSSITGNFTNGGNITLTGNVLTSSSSTKNTRPEAGSALVISGNVTGGIVNAGPFDTTLSVPAATLSSSGFTATTTATTTPTEPVVLIGPNGATLTAPLVIGPDNVDAGDTKTGFSFYNRGNIVAAPLNTNDSATTIAINGMSSAFPTILTGGIFNSGTISALATSTSGTNAQPVLANAINIGAYAQVPSIVLSNESITGTTPNNGAISASISGQIGGRAIAISIAQNATVPVLDLMSGTRIVASATTSEPTTTTLLSAFGVVDQSGTLTTINNGGTISAIATTLTPGTGVTIQANGNITQAINLVKATTGVTINNAGSIVGDVYLNSIGNGALFNVGAGAATSGSPAQVAAAAAAAVATGVTNTPAATGGTPAIVTGNVFFGTGQSTLNINDYGTLTGAVTSGNGALDVAISKFGTLDLTNTLSSLVVQDFTVNKGTISIPVSESLRELNDPSIAATGNVVVATGSNLGVAIGTFVPQGNNAYALIQAPHLQLTVQDLATYEAKINSTLPFFFDPTKSSLQFVSGASTDTLMLNLTPKTAAQLGLKGAALTMFNNSQLALATDTDLGAAVVNGISDPAQGTGTTAEQVFSQFAPDVSGDIRAVAIALTDQASGPVAARQRVLRQYANQEGDFSIWGQEFAQYINNKAATRDTSDLTAFKDHGFGFALGLDSGTPQAGWYGGAFTFFAGDATQTLPRDSKTQTQWYMLSGYTDWRGAHLFLDTQASIALGDFKGKRFLSIQIPVQGSQPVTFTPFAREADSKRAGLLGALGATTGAVFNWGSAIIMPTISVDGLTLREEGFTEGNGGTGFDLKVQPYFANSARGYFGVDARQDIEVADFTVQPEARVGYRYELLNDPIKVTAQYPSGGLPFTVTGADPTRGNIVAGATIGASTDTWSMGVNFDWVRGTNGSQTEVGTLSLLGRI